MEEKKMKQTPAQAQTAQKKIKPKNVQFHVGVTLKPNGAGGVVNSVGTKPEHKDLTLELHPAGVVIRYPDNETGKLIPYTNIQGMDVEFVE